VFSTFSSQALFAFGPVKIPLILKSVYDVKEFPESFADYEVVCDWTNENLPKGVKLHKRHE